MCPRSFLASSRITRQSPSAGFSPVFSCCLCLKWKTAKSFNTHHTHTCIQPNLTQFLCVNHFPSPLHVWVPPILRILWVWKCVCFPFWWKMSFMKRLLCLACGYLRTTTLSTRCFRFRTWMACATMAAPLACPHIPTRNPEAHPALFAACATAFVQFLVARSLAGKFVAAFNTL